MTNTRWHDLDCAYAVDSSEFPDQSLLEEAHWLEMEYHGDNTFFIEMRLVDSQGQEINFFVSKATANKINRYLSDKLRNGR